MNPNRPPAWLLPAVAGLIVLAPFGSSAVRFAWVSMFRAPKPFLEVPDTPFRRCVRDPAWMRQNHMVLLRELRDGTVRRGIRNKVTLGGCSQCHKHKARFCDQCHNAVNLHPDCFDCHFYSTTGHTVVLLEGAP